MARSAAAPLGGNPKTRLDARGKLTSYAYDALNRISQISHGDQTIAYVWDSCTNGLGRLCQIADGAGGTTYVYDAAGNLTQDGTATYTYGYVRGNPVSYTDPTGEFPLLLIPVVVSVVSEGNWNLFPWKLPGPTYPNGNYSPGYEKQDWKCSSAAAPFNFDKCSKQCCVAHDACYQKYRCNQSSWTGNQYNKRAACQQCNEEVVRCILNNFGKENCGPACGDGAQSK